MPLTSYASLLRQVWTAPGNAGHRVQALVRAAKWFQVRHQIPAPEAPVLLPVFDRQRTYPCYADSIIAKHVMYRSEWFDWDMLHFLRDYLQPGDHFLDVGANIGLHTLLASTRLDPAKGGHITCIEPEPRNLTRLRHTLSLNHLSESVTVHPVAASDTEGTVTLTDHDAFARIRPVAEGADLGHFEAEGADLGSSNPQSEIRNPRSSPPVPAIPLDKLLSGSETIHACKIDVEGAEWQVLQGATHLIKSGRLPCLILEFCGHLDRYGKTDTGFLDWLRTQGYLHHGVYDHTSRVLRHREDTDEDLYAFTAEGFRLLQHRLPELRKTL